MNFWLFESFNITLASTLLIIYDETFPATGNKDRAGFIQGFQAYPEYKTTTNLTVKARNWSVSWSTRYISAMDDFLRLANLTDDTRTEYIWYQDIYIYYVIGEL